jgi:hypothetical protein
MGCDNFAFSIFLASDRTAQTNLIKKALGAKKQLSEKESDIFDQILFRNEIQAFPSIAMPSGRIQF